MSSDAIACPRDRRLKLAVVASIGSKIATSALQILVMPLAVRALGPERFGIFILLSSSLIWISSVSVGLGNSLMILISKANATDDNDTQTRALSSAFFTVVSACILFASTISAIYYKFGITGIIGAQCSNYQPDMDIGLWLLVGYMAASLVLDVLEGAQSGCQEMHIVSLAGMMGQVLSGIALFAVIRCHAQSIVHLILCLFVVALVPRLINATLFITILQPHLFPNFWHFDRTILKGLLSTSIAFTMIALGQFLKQQCTILLVGRALGPAAVASYAILFNLSMLAAGIIIMQLRPLIPAITDAVIRGDYGWIKHTCSKILRSTLGYAVVVGVGMSSLSNAVIGTWYGKPVAPGLLLQVAMGIAFILQAWETYHHHVLFGLGYVWLPMIVYICQNVLTLALAVPLVQYFGSAGAACSLCIGILVLDGWVLPIMLRRAMAISS